MTNDYRIMPTSIRQKNSFFKFSILIAIVYWFIESIIHNIWFDSSVFEIIPSDNNELWMRISISILLISFGLFTDLTSRKIIEKNNIRNRIENISRAKKQWELVIDSLPQLIIVMDKNARITRVNRTIETWNIGKVDKVNGLYILDFLRHFNNEFSDNDWIDDWTYIWEQLETHSELVRKIEKKHTRKTFLYTLKNISNFDINEDQNYVVLIIDDITTRQDIEKSLKEHASELEKLVNERTKELKITNTQLENELQAKEAANKKLNETQISRLSLLHEIFTTQEKERKRIAHELHDSIGQSLAATKFKLEEILLNKQNSLNKTDNTQLNSLVESMQSSIHEVRHIAMDLRPAMLDDLGALATLKWFCREYEKTYTQIKVSLFLNIEESDITDNKKIVIFRITQEAMNNIAKHSNATDIVIEINKLSSDIEISIKDNGCGFDINSLSNNINQPRSSFGLSSMRERAESTEGEFVIKSSKNCGTSITVSWNNNTLNL